MPYPCITAPAFNDWFFLSDKLFFTNLGKVQMSSFIPDMNQMFSSQGSDKIRTFSVHNPLSINIGEIGLSTVGKELIFHTASCFILSK